MCFKWLIQLLFFIPLTSILYAQALFFHSKISLDEPNVFKLAEDKNGHVWACTNNGLFLIQSNEIKKFNTTNGTLSDKFYCIYIDEHNRKWAGTDEGIVVIDSSDKLIYNYPIKNTYSIKEIICHGDYLYFFTGTNYFVIYNLKIKKVSYFKKFSFNKNLFFTYKLKIFDDNVYLASDEGLFVFKDGSLIEKKYYKVINDLTFNSDDLYFCSGDYLFKDDNGELDSIYLNIKQPIHRIYSFKNFLFILTLANNPNAKSKLFVYNINRKEIKTLAVVPNMTDLCITQNSKVFISMLGGGVSLNNFIQYYFYDITSDDYVVDIYKGSDYSLFGTNKYLLFYDEASKKSKQLTISSQNSIEYIRKILSYKKNKFVVAYASALSQKYKYLKYDSIEINAFNAKNIYLHDSVLYVNSYSGTIELYNLNSLKCIDTLPISKENIKVYDFYQSDSMLYLSSNLGLYKINVKSKAISIIYKLPVRSYCEFNDYSVVTTNNHLSIMKNNYYSIFSNSVFGMSFKNFNVVGFKNFILLFNNNNVYFINKNYHVRYFYTFFKINNIKYINDVLYIFTESGLLSAPIYYYFSNNNNNIYTFNLFKFETNSLVFEKLVESKSSRFNFIINTTNNFMSLPLYFRFKLDNSKWIYLKDNYISFRLNDSKIHTLYIQYSESGVEWKPAYSLFIKYKKPFYNSYLFYISIFLVFSFFFAMAIRLYYMNKVKKLQFRINYIQELEKLKYQNFTHSINAHFIMNTLNALQYFISNNKKNISLEIVVFFGRFLRQSIDSAEKLHLSISEELNRTVYYLKVQQIKSEYAYSFTIDVDPSLNINAISCPTLILQPFIENSIIHGFESINYKGFIYVKVFKLHNLIYFQIIDNGKGLIHSNKEKKRKSIGISYTIERLKLFVGRKYHYYYIKPLTINFGVITTIIYQFDE